MEHGSHSGPIECRTRLICVLLTLTVFPLIAYCPLICSLAATYFLWFSWKPLPLVALFSVVAWFLPKQMAENYHWVELDGSTIRGRKLLTRRIVEGTLDDVATVVPLRAMVKNLTNMIVDRVLDSSIRGFEIRMKNGDKIALVRYDMKGFDEFILALHDARPECFLEKGTAAR